MKVQPGKDKSATSKAEAAVKTKVATKAVVKEAVKEAVKAAVKKAPAKALPKPVAAEPKVAKPPAPKEKVKLKEPVKTTAKAKQPDVAVSKPKVTHSVAAGTLAKAALPAKTAAAAVVATSPASLEAAGVPARAGRPSSRLAQLTVPSMAQSVASTAAKASFTQTTPVPFIVPPLASSVKKDPKLANNWKTKPVAELSDAEVIAMPDTEFMNDVQLAYFRLKLTALKVGILSNAGETTEHLREETVVVPDPTDRATIEEEHALELRTRDRERKLLKKIEQSIVRIDAGEYGYCDETGEAIGVGRLLARPTANLSLEAQQRRELRQKMFGD